MKTIVLRNSGGSIRVEYKVDLFSIPTASGFDRGDNFTVMEIVGLDDDDVIAGVFTKQLAYSVGEFADFATANSLGMEIVDIDTSIPTEIVVPVP